MSDMQVMVSDPDVPGGWLALQRPDGVLTLTADTFATATATLKRTSVSNPLLPGTHTVRVLPDTVTEVIGVFVDHPSPRTHEELVAHLVALFTERVRYSLRWIHDDLDVMMVGQAADYVRNTQREFRHAGRTQLTFNVPVLPGRTVL